MVLPTAAVPPYTTMPWSRLVHEQCKDDTLLRAIQAARRLGDNVGEVARHALPGRRSNVICQHPRDMYRFGCTPSVSGPFLLALTLLTVCCAHAHAVCVGD